MIFSSILGIFFFFFFCLVFRFVAVLFFGFFCMRFSYKGVHTRKIDGLPRNPTLMCAGIQELFFYEKTI